LKGSALRKPEMLAVPLLILIVSAGCSEHARGTVGNPASQETLVAVYVTSPSPSGPLEIVTPGPSSTLLPPTAPAATPNLTATRVYSNLAYRIELRYPAGWKPVPGYVERYGGEDGFFMINAMSTGNLSLQEACDENAHHRLQPYGTQPTVEILEIQNEPGCLILPSSDQPKEEAGQAALIVRYPHQVDIGGTTYQYFILWADKQHIQSIAGSLQFLESPP
jgi:hypothetical protein